MKKVLKSLGFFFIVIYAIIAFIIMIIGVTIVAMFNELYMYIFQREIYKAMRKETALQKYYNSGKENSLYL